MKIPDMNLDPAAVPWARTIQDKVLALEADAARRAQTDLAVNKGQNGTLTALGTQIINLDASVQEAFDNLTVDAAQVDSGVLDVARLPLPIDQSNVTGTWSKGVSTSSAISTSASGSFAASLSSSGASATDLSGIAGLRQTVWQLYTGANTGLYGYAPSTIKSKTNWRSVTYKASQFLACIAYWYEYLGQVAIRDDPEHPEYDPKYEVPSEVGYMAEHLIKNGLIQFVTMLDGEPIGIDYAAFAAVGMTVIGREHEARLAAIERELGL